MPPPSQPTPAPTRVPAAATPPHRVISYIDGFNLYFGLGSKGWRRYYWLNLHSLSSALLKPGQSLAQVKYFTSRVSSTPSDPDQHKWQNVFLEAIATLPGTSLFFGPTP